MNKKKYRYLISPIKSAIATYIIISLIRYAILQDSFVANNIEVIMFSIMVGIMESVGAKIDDVSPRDPKKEPDRPLRSEEHTSELQSRFDLVCRLLLEKKNTKK